MSYLLVLVAAAAWASIGIPAEKLFTIGLEPKEVIWFRAAVCFSAMTLITIIFNRPRLKIALRDVPLFCLYGFVSVALFYYAYLNTIDKTGVAMAVILLYTAPAMVVLLSRFIFHEAINTKKILCIILTVTGCFLVVKGYDTANLILNMSGILLGLLAGFCFAMYSIFGKKTSAHHHPWTVIIYTQGFALLFLSILHFPAGVFTAQHQSAVWHYLLYIGLVPTLLAYLCYTTALKKIEAGLASIIATLEPVMAVFFAYIFLGQVLDPIQTLGAALVIAAVITVQLPGRAGFFKHGLRQGKSPNINKQPAQITSEYGVYTTQSNRWEKTRL
ncbi:MAG: DMT family transporter [Firmicutes bacterium]|nr:DMT family transporter [Bacillota bacterium]